MTVTEAPRIVTSRLGFDDSFTIERYLATGGYEGLKKALDDDAGRGRRPRWTRRACSDVAGAGFPAGRKWSMLRKAPTTYLVINGDESEPATFKDHLLIERDPHQIIEGVLIAAYAIGAAQAFIYVPGRVRSRPRTDAAGAATRRTRTARSAGESSGRSSASTSSSTPAPGPTYAVRRRRCSRASRARGASRGSSPRISRQQSAFTGSRPS